MTTTTISTSEDLERFECNGAIGHGAFVRDNDGGRWLAHDTEDGAQCVRPRYEGEDEMLTAMSSGGRRFIMPVVRSLDALPFPLTITTERN